MNNDIKNKKDKLMKAISEEHIKALSDEYRVLSDESPNVPRSDEWLNDFLKCREAESTAESTNEDKIVKMTASKRKPTRFFSMNRTGTRVAVFIVALLLVSSAVGLSTEAIRLRVFNLFTESNEEFTRITLGEDTDLVSYILVNWKGAYYLTLIPENYELVDANEVNDLKKMIYRYQDNLLIFKQDLSNSSTQLDTEDAEAESMVIEGQSAVFTEKNDIKLLVWIGSDGTYFRLSSTDENIKKSDLVIVAENLEKIK